MITRGQAKLITNHHPSKQKKPAQPIIESSIVTRSQTQLQFNQSGLISKTPKKSQNPVISVKLPQARQPLHQSSKLMSPRASVQQTPKAKLKVPSLLQEDCKRAMKTCVVSPAQTPRREMRRGEKGLSKQPNTSVILSPQTRPQQKIREGQHTETKNLNRQFLSPSKKLGITEPKTPQTLPATPVAVTTCQKPQGDIQLVGVYRFTRSSLATNNVPHQITQKQRSVSGRKRSREESASEPRGLNISRKVVHHDLEMTDASYTRLENEFETSTKRRQLSIPPSPNTHHSVILKSRRSDFSRDFTMFRDETVFPELQHNGLKQDQQEKHEECDYSTDEENMCKAQRTLISELNLAVQFYVEENPLDLVENVKRKFL